MNYTSLLFLTAVGLFLLGGCQAETEFSPCVPVPELTVPAVSNSALARDLRWINSIHDYVEENVQSPLPPDTVRRLAAVSVRIDSLADQTLTAFSSRADRMRAAHYQNLHQWDTSRIVLLASAARLEAIPTLSGTQAYELGYHYNLLSLAGMEVFRPEEALMYGERALDINMNYGYSSEAVKDVVNLGITELMSGMPDRQEEVFRTAWKLVRASEDCLQSDNDRSAVASVAYNSARTTFIHARRRKLAGAEEEARSLARKVAADLLLADSLLRAYGLHDEANYRIATGELAASAAVEFPFLLPVLSAKLDSVVSWAETLELPESHPARVVINYVCLGVVLARIRAGESCTSPAGAKTVADALQLTERIEMDDLPKDMQRLHVLLRRRIASLEYRCSERTEDQSRQQLAHRLARGAITDYEAFLLARATEPQLEFMGGDFAGFYSDFLTILRRPGEDFVGEALAISDRTKSLTLRLAFEKRKSEFDRASLTRARLLFRERELATAIREAKQANQVTALSLANQTYEGFLDSLAAQDEPEVRELLQNFRTLKPLSLSELRREFVTDQRAAIDLFYGNGEIMVTVVTANDLAQFLTPVSAALVDALEYPYSEAAGPRALAYAHDVYRAVFAEPVRWLRKNSKAKALIVASDHRLPALDVGLLPTRKPAEGAIWGQQPMVYDDYNLTYAYSLSSLLAKRELAKVERQPEYRWGVFTATHAQTGADRDATPALPRLTASIDRMENDFLNPAMDRVAERAHRKQILQQADRYRYLMFVAHGFTDEVLPERYYLQFNTSRTEGYLTTYDLYGLKLRADLSLAINCESAEGLVHNFEGKKSIARALSYAGSRGVIAGQGNLPDLHTAEIVQRFNGEFMRENRTAADALHAAKMTYRRENKQLDPFAWNGLVYFGDPDVSYSANADMLTQRVAPTAGGRPGEALRGRK
jgi:CHAT domain-containing protein